MADFIASNDESQWAPDVGLISPKFVPLGSRDRVIDNLCLSFKEFRRKLRWKWYFREKQESTHQQSLDDAFIDETDIGLNTRFKTKPKD